MQDLLLQPRELRVADLDAEVAARDHHRIARLDDFLEARDRLAALDLGDDAGIAARSLEQGSGFLDVGRLAHERDGEIVDLQRRGQPHVLPVLVGQRLRGQAAAAPIDALVVRELAAGEHAAFDARAFDPDDPQLDLAVAEDQLVARLHVGRKVRIGHADRAVRAFVGAEAGIERKRLPLREHGGTASEALDADLGALQVAEHRHVLADRSRGLPHGLHSLAVIARLAVREIDSDDVGPAADDVLEDAGRVGGRAQGGDDFCATKH